MTIEDDRRLDRELAGVGAFTEVDTRQARFAIGSAGTDVIVIFAKPIEGLVFSGPEARRVADLLRGAAAAGQEEDR